MIQQKNDPIWNLTREQWFQAVCFSLCFLAFMLAESAVNARAAVLLGPERVNAVYALGLVCTGLGFLSFALLRKLIRGEQGRKYAAFLAGALCVASAVLFLTTDQTALFSLGAALCLLSCGHIGGCVYYNHAMTFQGSRCTGRITGIGMGLAVLLQFLIQSVIPLDVIFLISMIGSIFLVVFLMSRAPRDWVLADPLPYSAENETPRRTALILLSAVLAFATDKYLTTSNMLSILRQVSANAIIAFGMTYVLICGSIDLSVGSVCAFSGCMMDFLLRYNVPFLLAVLL